jgi:2-polyprenyl-3-methyl-5-hydroxy-6-metoxy-1,4-benzoquinol methylase
VSSDPRVAFFDDQAPQWDAQGPPLEQILARLESLAPHFGLCPGGDVLEVGCGTGQATAWLAGQIHPGKVTAIDSSPRMLQRAAARGAPAELRLADACTDDLGQGLYQTVFCMHVFPHFRDKPAAVRILARAMRPDGQLVILHLLGRHQLQQLHAQAGGPVVADLLPEPGRWPALLQCADLHILHMLDQDDLFLLTARRHPPDRPRTG